MHPRRRALHVAQLALATAVSAGSAPSTPTLPSQQAQPAAGTPAVAETVGVTAARVAVDLVVRDKKGRLVRDLSRADIEVLQDGVSQEVLSLRLVDTVGGARVAPGRRPDPSAGPATTSPEEHPLYLAFLFDRLSPQARRTAHDAAIEWLEAPAAATVSASGGRPLPFFLIASPAPGRNALGATIELRQGETPVFSAPADFVPAVGRSTLLGGVPLEGITPGEYELRVTVADGVDRAVRWARVTVTP